MTTPRPSLPPKTLNGLHSLAAVFPHPDDESLTCGGTLHQASGQGIATYLLLLTQGERGVEGAVLTPALKSVRKQEAKRSAQTLGISRLILDDYGDGELSRKQAQVKARIYSLLDSIAPQAVITYDRSGLYGHPDHMIVSDIVTAYAGDHPNIRLWYAVRSEKDYQRMQLPIHMAKDPNFIKLRRYPTFKISLSLSDVVAKIKSLYAHKSQHFAFKKSRPWLPLWFYVLSQSQEYFYEVQ